MASSHDIHPRAPIKVTVDTYKDLPGAWIELRVDQEQYTLHFESIGQSLELASRIYDAAYKLAHRMRQPSQTPETEKANGSQASFGD